MNTVRRSLISVCVLIIGLIVIFGAYWSLQRNQVFNAAQNGLNKQFQTSVHINAVTLDAVGSLSKWVVLPFRRHDWFVTYEVPKQGNATSMAIVGQNQHGQWVYEPTPPTGP